MIQKDIAGLLRALQCIIFTRPDPDIVFFFLSVKEVSKFMHEKRAGFMDSIKWTQRDRKGTISNELVYTQSTLLKRDPLRCGNLFRCRLGSISDYKKDYFSRYYANLGRNLIPLSTN